MTAHRLQAWILAALLLGAGGSRTGLAAQSGGITLSINDVTVPFETNGGAGLATFTVSLHGGSHNTITVFFSTTGGTATAGNQCGGSTDYLSVNSAALTFSPTDSVKQINITVCGDTRDEPDETFSVNIFNASGGATIQKATGTATLIDDDPPPSIRINNVTVTEGNAGAVGNAVFTVTLSAASDNQITVAYTTANGTATGGGCGTNNVDYGTNSGSLTFAPGQTSQTVNVPVCGDNLREGNEQFQVRLSNPTNATIQTGTGTATISDDDPLPVLNIAPADLSVSEPASRLVQSHAVVHVTLTGVTAQTVSVQYTTNDNFARGGTNCTISFNLPTKGTSGTAGDFIRQQGTLTFAPNGPTTQDISIPICFDLETSEADENFSVKILNPANATIGNAFSKITILAGGKDND